MLGDVGWEIGSVFSKQVNVEDNLIVLNTSIFVGCALYTQRFQEIPDVGFALLIFIEFNLVHNVLLMCSYLMIAYVLSKSKKKQNGVVLDSRKELSMNFLSKLFKSRDKPKNSLLGGGHWFFFGGSSSGKAVNERSAMQMTAVYACVRVLSESIAGLPLHLFRYNRERNGKTRDFQHPLSGLLHDAPNPEMTSFVFRETLMTHLLLWGNAFAQIIRNGRGQVVALYPLMPDRMEVCRDGDGEIYYLYTKATDENPKIKAYGTVRLRKDNVMHIPGLGFDGLVGYSPIAMAKNAIGMAIACEEFGAKFFANGASPSGVLEHPGTIKDPQRVQDAWQSQFGGSSNAGKVAVLEEGMKYSSIGISPDQAQFLETRKFQIDEIARIFRVPPHMIGDLEKSTFSNIEQQSLEFVKYTLGPWVARWEQAMSQALLTPEERTRYEIHFNVDGLLRGDYESRMNGYAVGRQNGWLSANDIRELENMNRIPEEEGGDLYLINGNMTKLKDAGLFAGSGNKEEPHET
nr:MAG TPA: Portal [Caudoviricetes sp.]